MKCLAFLFALILMATASPSPQLFPSGYSPLLARYAGASQAPASTVHADHVAALSPVTTYVAPYPYAYVRYAAPEVYGFRYAYL